MLTSHSLGSKQGLTGCRNNSTPFSGTKPCGRALSVQVFAKGKSAFRSQMGVPGQGASAAQMQQMQMGKPPTPEVDPENVEFVIFLRAKEYRDPTTKTTLFDSAWMPLSIVKGGQSANFLVKVMETEWGNKLYGKTLVRNIAGAVYKERADVEKQLRKRYPPFQNTPSNKFEYAIKIRDKSVPDAWSKAENLIFFPAEGEMGPNGLDQVKQFFSSENIMSMFQAPQQQLTN